MKKWQEISLKITGAFFRGWLIGCLISIPILIGLYSTEQYYKSDMYAESQKEFILDNIDEFNVTDVYWEDDNDSTIFDMEIKDDYYESITIDLSTGRVICWSNRENNSYLHEFKWTIISDTDFYLDYNKEIDSKIINALINH